MCPITIFGEGNSSRFTELDVDTGDDHYQALSGKMMDE